MGIKWKITPYLSEYGENMAFCIQIYLNVGNTSILDRFKSVSRQKKSLRPESDLEYTIKSWINRTKTRPPMKGK